MRHFVKFPSIEQFRSVVASVNRKYNFVGLDENGDAIYDNTKPKPVLSFTGTVKLHGTNAGICFNNHAGFWFQSRERIISVENDNYGFSAFCEEKILRFKQLFLSISNQYNIDMDKFTISIFGEWCGKSIQNNVAVSELPKSFYIFGIKVTPIEGDDEARGKESYWVDYAGFRDNDFGIFNILDFETFSIDVDFNMPELSQNKLVELTEYVEKECPVGKHFGISGIGEGIVWSIEVNGEVYRFKTKGEKHSSSKVKTVASVDVERLNGIVEFIEYAVTESRFNQALENVFPNNEAIDVKKLGDVIKWVMGDIIKEETDTMEKNGLSPKDIGKYVSDKVRKLFFAKSV
jgi:hypothetical protein